MRASSPVQRQVTQLYAENQKLKEALVEKEREIMSLKDLADMAAELHSQDVQAAKIIELSKKVQTGALVVQPLHALLHV